MSNIDKLEAYHFYEEEWESYDELRDAFEWGVPETFNIASYVCDRWADEKKNNVALYAERSDRTETAYSFRQIRNMANQLANYLAERGIEKGDRIGVNGTQRVEPLVTHIAAFKLGAVSVPLSVLLGPDGLRYRLEDSSAKAFVVDRGAADALRSVRDDLDDLSTVLTMEDFDEGSEQHFWEAIEDHSRTFETMTTDAEDDACIIYTSGTTGSPKGVVHAHRHLLGILPGFVRGRGSTSPTTS